jgi:hypothetical protein
MMATNDERDILTLALTGTRHSGSATPQTTPPVDQLALAEGEAERALLLRAGAWAVYRRAGYLPADAPEPPDPAPADARFICLPEAGEAIATLLHARRFDLLPEALARLNAAGLRLPPAVLPLALSSIGMPVELRAAMAPAMGERGRWLARFNRAWSWATEPPGEALDEEPARELELWETGTLRQRVAALRGMRRRDPAAARDLLAAEWKREKAEARAALLAPLAVNLSLADEPLLNTALADRIERVRQAAADLLFSLPGSRLAVGVRALIESSLRLDAGADGGALDAVTPPAAMVKDEWLRTSLAAALGHDEWASGRLPVAAILAALGYIPPEHWETRFGLPPDGLIAAITRATWRSGILHGWTEATVRYGSARWAEPLWRAWLEARQASLGSSKGEQVYPGEEIAELAPLLPRETLEGFALEVITHPAEFAAFSSAQALNLLERPWSATFASAFLDALRELLEATSTSEAPPQEWMGALPIAGIALPASSFRQAGDICVIADQQHRNLIRWGYPLAHFSADLFLRERYIKELPLP